MPGLDRHEHAGFSHAIELFQVEADATIELENIRSNCLACRISEPHLAETEPFVSAAWTQILLKA